MRVFVAGATGVIGSRIVRLLVARGDTVAGMGRTAAAEALGAMPLVVDAFDADAVRAAVEEFAPDVVINELTQLPDRIEDLDLAPTARIRRVGNANLLAALGDAKYLVQSIAYELSGEAGEAVRELERTALAAGGVVLRYGLFYEPGTYSEQPDPDNPHVQIDYAAQRTVEAIDAPSGVIVVTD
jgi:nucleoside-diphosphate-sugar epimerase